MCKIFFSINPEHVDHILDGSKEYEFRKTKCKEEIDGIIIYCAAPVKQVIAEVDVAEILEDTPKKIWFRTQKKSGISAEFFFKYYEGREKAVAYKLANIINLMTPRHLQIMAYRPLRKLSHMYEDKELLNYRM